jgi:hypothetical protein
MSVSVAVRFRSHSNIPQLPEPEQKEQTEDINSKLAKILKPDLHIHEDEKYIRVGNDFNLHFDEVFSSDATQDDIASSSIMKNLSIDFLAGQNCSLISYGAQQSGKTYSMFGKLDEQNAVLHLGLMPRIITYVINKIESQSKIEQQSLEWNCLISFGEIYQVL